MIYDLNKWNSVKLGIFSPEVYSEPRRISKVDFFAKIFS